MRRLWIVALAWMLGCGDDDGTGLDAGVGPGVDSGVDAGAVEDSGVDVASTPFEVSTTAWVSGEAVPETYRCGPPLIPDMTGGNVSPPISWTAGPEGTASYALVIRDMSAGGLVHWAIYDIPVALRELPEDVPGAFMPLRVDGARQAEIQGSGFFGYFGPCSGGRGNTYVFTLHAMPDAMLPGVTRDSTENEIATAVESSSIAMASFTGTF
ncbi:MAG: YbhB/YbcL family Raf kinase inhibitor-like protein [Myxococcota bacterium]